MLAIEQLLQPGDPMANRAGRGSLHWETRVQDRLQNKSFFKEKKGLTIAS